MIYLKTILAITAIAAISGCVKPEPNTITVTKLEPVNIPVVNQPNPPSLVSPKIYVVNSENYDEFVERFVKANGELVYVAISIKDYENLSINLEEIRAHVIKQKEIIVYYEEAIKDSKNKVDEVE